VEKMSAPSRREQRAERRNRAAIKHLTIAENRRSRLEST
jgi:hypothetical protein